MGFYLTFAFLKSWQIGLVHMRIDVHCSRKVRWQACSLFLLCVTTLLSACTPENSMMPTPAIYEGPGARRIFDGAFAANPPQVLDLLYVTDREEPSTLRRTRLQSQPVARDDVRFGAAPDRGRRAGAGLVHAGAFTAWDAHAARLVSAYALRLAARRRGVTRDPAAVTEHTAAVQALQAEVSRRLARAPRKEVVIFIHGYNNSFGDAAYSTGNICRFLGAEFVCVVLSWPAGGSSGLLFGYNVDRESGEFAVAE